MNPLIVDRDNVPEVSCVYLMYDDNGDTYTGSTTDLKRRIRRHKLRERLPKCAILKLLGDMSKEDRFKEEQLFQTMLKPTLNHNMAYNHLRRNDIRAYDRNRPRAEYKKQIGVAYRVKNREHRRLYNLEYRRTHRSSDMVLQKEWCMRNPSVPCQCGGKICAGGKNRHLQTQRHIDWLKTVE